jgi:hypothetical protein
MSYLADYLSPENAGNRKPILKLGTFKFARIIYFSLEGRKCFFVCGYGRESRKYNRYIIKMYLM